jgi:hypothetical protein
MSTVPTSDQGNRIMTMTTSVYMLVYVSAGQERD